MSYRYERKFHLEGVPANVVESEVRLHPACFSEIYAARWVNSLYFETPQLDHYFESVDGSHIRNKIRIRWYGDLEGEVQSPVLEFKRKRGLVGTKDHYELPPFRIDGTIPLEEIRAMADALPVEARTAFRMVTPLLVVRYRRKYFLSADRAYRITIDSDLEYYEVRRAAHPILHRVRDDASVVVELKYDEEHDERKFPFFLPYRLTKNSKFQNAVTRLFAW